MDFSNFNSLISVINHFHDENTCKDALAQSRWGDDVVCPHCDQHHCAKRIDGRTVAMKVEDAKAKTLMPIIKQFVRENAHLLTDELSSYQGLNREGYSHDYVSHGSKEFVRPNGIHTNSIEGFWAHFRRMITGCYHDVSDEHLQQYIDEAVYRWNTRKMDESERFAHMFAKSIGLIVRWCEVRINMVS